MKRCQSDREKFESVYSDADAIKECVNLLEAIGLYLSSISGLDQNKIASDCVAFATTQISSQLKSIRQAVDNTKVQQGCKQAHAKISAAEKRMMRGRKQQLQLEM